MIPRTTPTAPRPTTTSGRAALRSDHDDVELFVYADDLPEPTETEHASAQSGDVPLDVALSGYDQAQENYTEALQGWAAAEERAARATTALRSALNDLHAAADAGHLDGGLDAARQALQVALEAATAAAPARRPEPGGGDHLWNGRCPEPDHPMSRDPDCPACQQLAGRRG